MKSNVWTVVLMLFLVVACTSHGNPSQLDADRSKLEQREFKELMRGKLLAHQSILEGLVTDDFKLIEQGTKRLQKIDTSPKWKQAEDALIRQQRAEFGRIVKAIEKRAADEKLDASALKLVDLTMKCVECHRAVNSVLVAKGGIRSWQQMQPSAFASKEN